MGTRASLPRNNKAPSILVIGDWVIDDCWVVGEHKSDTSTFVGQKHYRSLHHPGGMVKRHCGAGRVAAILRSAHWSSSKATAHIHGLGLWAETDADLYLSRMFTAEHLLGSNSHRVVPHPDNTPALSDITLHNLGDVLRVLGFTQFRAPNARSTADNPFVATAELKHDEHRRYFGTTRVYRFFLNSLKGLSLLSRLDWELPPHYLDGTSPSWLPPLEQLGMNRAQAQKTLASKLRSPTDISAVLIKDNGKGVVSTTLLDMLISKFPHLQSVPWFIQTKRWNPPFLRFLEDAVPVALLVYHKVALDQCKDVDTWLTSRDRVSLDALKALVAIDRKFSVPVARRMTVLLTGPFSAIALEVKPEAGVARVLYQPVANPNALPLKAAAGSATALFTSIAFGMLQDSRAIVSTIKRNGTFKERTSTVSGSHLLDGGLRVAQFWSSAEHRRLSDPESLKSPEEVVLSLKPLRDVPTGNGRASICLMLPDAKNKLHKHEIQRVGDIKSIPDIKSEMDTWDDGLQRFGLINGSRLELPRATIELKDYVCCAPTKRRQIATLMTALRGFSTRSLRSTSGLLLAKPGSGKTTLVRNMARDLDLHLLSYNITNMMCFDDLLSSFDQIATAQADNKDKAILVFVDEINAKIEQQFVYEAFLTPLEDGYYVRSGSKRIIRPCIWIFVGTSTLTAIKKAAKGSDFASRLSLEPTDISEVPKREEWMLQLENVYVGGFISRNEFPGLTKLHRDVIALLAGFRTSQTANGVTSAVSLREIRQLVSREIRVDGLGRGNWRDRDRVLERYDLDIDRKTLDKNNDYLMQCSEWVSVCPDVLSPTTPLPERNRKPSLRRRK